MRNIFKTGTFLTADNLNLAQRASGLTGVVTGCNVTHNENLLYISEGIVKFEDGTVVKFDGNETIDISNIVVEKKYQVVVVKYSDYSLDYSIVDSTPEYEYVVLADVVVNSMDSIEIINSYKSSIAPNKYDLGFDYLKAYLENAEGVTIEETASGIKHLHLRADASSGVDYVWRDFKIGFIANGSISKITVKGSLTESNQIKFILKINGSEDYDNNISGNNTADAYSMIVNPNGNNDVDFVLGVPYGKIENNSKCQLIIRLFNRLAGMAIADLYNIIIN